MASSTLRLVIQKGPREGETLEFNPRSMVRIGRVVKGNNVTIKDSGISSKHLQIEFNSTSRKWVITDLDSSNGTFLNSSEIKPLSPFEISQGDEIKIGEFTAIRVEIVEISVRRNPRRQGVVHLTENVEIKEDFEKCKNPRKRGVCKDGADLGGEDDEGSKLGENVEIKEVIENFKNPSKLGVCKNGGDKIEENVEVKGDMNGGRNIQEVGNKVEERGEDCLNLEEEAEGRRRGRGRGRPKKASNLKDGNLGDGENVENAKSKPECGVSTRRTRSSKRGEDELVNVIEAMPARRTRSAKNAEVLMEKIEESKGSDADECKEVESVKVVENNKPRGGRGRKKKVNAEHLDKIQEAVLEKMNLEVLKKDVVDKGLRLSEQHCVELMAEKDDSFAMNMSEQHFQESMDEPNQKNDCVAGPSLIEEPACDAVESAAVFDDGRTEISGIEDLDKESEANCCDVSKDPETSTLPDLEKMTLGEWFDFLEVYLPKKIYAAGDRIIEDMRKQAKLFDDFMLQHQKDKCKLPLDNDQATS